MTLLLLFGCPSPEDDSGTPTTEPTTQADCTRLDPDRTGDGAYQVVWTPDPAPITAGVPTEFRYQVLGPEGEIVDDLQLNHERMIHFLAISADLESFQHLHHEDTYPVTAETLRCGDWHTPLTVPFSGRYRLGFDYAHENQWLATHDWMDAGGEVPQRDAPVIDPATAVDVDGVHVEITWDTPAVAGFEAQWNIVVTEDGTDVTDLVQWLGADAHAVVISEDGEFLSHTHAWIPGVENMTPGMEMPHQYPGPYVPFHFTFPSAGWHKMWVQFARAAAPDSPYTVPFWFEVAP